MKEDMYIAAQKDYFAQVIREKGGYELVGIYADEGITGTSWKRREAFKQMMADCEAGLIDIIVTKSVSRFARNTVDSITAIRKLQSLGVAVYFQKENMWSNDSKGEFVLTLMSSLAQEESRNISENTKWGIRRRFAAGFYSVPYSHFLGYNRAEKCKMVVNPKEAKIVKLIYRLFLQGLTSYSIAKELTEKGIKTPAGCEKWCRGTVFSILTNEKYKGDALLQKRIYIDFISKKSIANVGQLPRYYVTAGHEAIIDSGVFDYVQQKIKERDEMATRYSGVTICSSKIICGHYETPYMPRPEHSNDERYRKIVWTCRNHFNKKVCGVKNTRIPDFRMEALFAAIAKAGIKTHPRALNYVVRY